MALTESIVTRAIDISGEPIKVFRDGNNVIQAIALTDAEGNHIYFNNIGDGDCVFLENKEGDETTKIIGIGGVTTHRKVRFLKTSDDGELETTNNSVLSLLSQILTVLKKIEIHQLIGSDNEIQDWEVA